MGFRTGAVITSTCFLLGILLSGLGKVDWPILYASSYTAEDLDRAERYYLTLFNAPGAVPALIHAMIGICLLALCTKIAQWEETNLFFDGSSCALVILAVALYASVSVPNLRVLALQPIDVAQSTLYGRFRSWLHQPMAAPAEALAIPEPLSEQDRFDVLSLLCASNNLIIGALVGVLLFQGAQAYAHRQAANELKRFEAAEKAAKSQ